MFDALIDSHLFSAKLLCPTFDLNPVVFLCVKLGLVAHFHYHGRRSGGRDGHTRRAVLLLSNIPLCP